MSDDTPRPHDEPGTGDPGRPARDEGGATAGPAKKRGLARRHPVLIGLATLVAVVAVAAGGFLYYLNHTIGNIHHVEMTESLDDAKRPVKVENEALNILMAGVDRGDGGSVGDFIDAGWEPGIFRSDTIMMLHIAADRDHAYLVSIPRDAYVRIYNENGTFEEMNKVNAALSVYGPAAYVSTIEHLTGLRMDHQVIVDWAGFKDISNALGGVEVYIPETFYDTSQRRWWYEGTQNLKGDDALAYVRTRYNLPDNSGDFGRIARQQNFLRSMMGEMLSRGTMANPVKLVNTLKAVVKYITVDNEFDTGEIRDLALSLRGLKTEDVTFVTTPWSGYGNQVGSTVLLDKKQCKALWKAMGQDDIASYINKFGNESGVLPGERNVS